MNRTTTKKKTAFSLTRLITICALAFVVPLAMAAEFGVSLDTSGDISHDDGLQLPDAATITLIIKFDQAVVLAAEDISVSAYDEDGAFLALSTASTIHPTTAAKEITITIPRPAGTARLTLEIRKGIASADPFNEDTSAEGKWDIGLLPDNPQGGNNPQGGPDVYQIALVGEPFETITTSTFQVHILLSEEPRDGFNKELLEVTNATVNSVVKLASPGPSATVNGTTVSATWRDNLLHLYLVTVETQRGEKEVTIKVKNFAGKETPTGALTQETYVRKPDNALTEGTDILTLKTNWDGTRTVVITVYLPDETTSPADIDTITTTENQESEATPADTVEKTETDAEATEVVAQVPDTSVSIPKDGQIYISEIMFAGGGRLPQWIEISNGSRTEQVNLSGWTLTVENATADADVSVGGNAVFTIPEGTRIDPSGQNDTPSTVLIVTDRGRNNLDGTMAEGQVVNLWVDQQVELTLLDISNRRYSLLSEIAFSITLAPPIGLIVTEQQTTARTAATDVVGNLAADGTAMWTLPMHEGGVRSSIIRRHVSAKPEDGEMMNSWILASDTGFAQSMPLTVRSYNGLSTDIGTPGFRAGGALPVELSHFLPERDASGTVMITWSTQSELNNTGFFIKRSQQRDREFKVINAMMVPGAGTTSEKRFYTYTDTTARPDVVYYYQIEDVSLNGNRQPLTRGIRLRGHVGAAGKAMAVWGDLKTQE